MITVGSSVPQIVTEITLDPSSVPAWSRQTETFTVTGVDTTMRVLVAAPNLESGVFLSGAAATATNVVTITFENLTSAAINPASQTFKVIAL